MDFNVGIYKFLKFALKFLNIYNLIILEVKDIIFLICYIFYIINAFFIAIYEYSSII